MRDTTANKIWLAIGASFVHLDSLGHLAQKSPSCLDQQTLFSILISQVRFRAF